MTKDEEMPEEIDHDPRWEVQPEPEADDDPGSNTRAALFAAVAMTAVVVLLAWLLANAQPVS